MQDRLDIVEQYKYLPINVLQRFRRLFFVLRSDQDEYLHEGKVALWMASRRWHDGGGASFLTYAYRAIWNHYASFWRSNRLVPIRSGNTERNAEASARPSSEEGLNRLVSHRCEVGGFFGAGAPVGWQEVDLQDLIAQKLDDFESKIVLMYLQGHAVHEIGEEIGFSRQWANVLLGRAARKLLDL